MAVDILSNQPGQVVAITGLPDGPPLSLSVEGLSEELGFLGILTSLSHAPHVNYQFQHALDRYIYAYVFGDRVGDMSVSGLVFAGCCRDSLVDTGWDAITRYWERCRMSRRMGHIIVAVGIETAYTAFLVDGQFILDDPERGLGKFSLVLKTIPDR